MQDKRAIGSSPGGQEDGNAVTPFRIDVSFKGPLRSKLFSPPYKLAERLLLFPHLNKLYAEIIKQQGDKDFLSKFLELMNVSYDISDEDLARIPKEGPLIVVANHPFGGIEAALMCVLLRSVRPDAKMLANFLLHRIPEVRDYCIFVDPFGAKKSSKTNFAPVREAVNWVKNGGALGLFPSGEVSHVSWRGRGIVDPEWSENAGRIIRMAKAPVLTIFIAGHNGPFFQVVGLIHPRLRTIMLPHEMLNKRNRLIKVTAGNVIPYGKLGVCTTDSEIMEYLRFRTYILENRNKPTSSVLKRLFPRMPARREMPVAQPEDAALMAAEVASLPASQMLIDSGEMAVYYAFAGQIKHVLSEIGRLRELAFRLEHEGTGKSRDLDRFDRHYAHLFVWNRARNEIVGAYRIARTDEVMERFGKKGLYTNTLFRYRKTLLTELGPALELGRSFVTPQYQKNYSSLLLLWRGIGQFVVKHPQYRNLFGPVSISNEYRSVSRWLLTAYLQHCNSESKLARLVKPRRRPPRGRPARTCAHTVFDLAMKDIGTVSSVISDIEGDEKGVPILIRQYLRLGGKILSFNLDPHFGNVVDGLILVDLVNTDRKQLRHFLGKEGLQSFLAYHNAGAASDPDAQRPDSADPERR